jgi:hypothetical protein
MKKIFRVNKYVVWGLVLLLLWTSTLSVSSQTTEGTKIIVDPGAEPATTCQDTTISVRVEDIFDLYAYSVKLNFDPKVVEIVDVTNSSFLETANMNVFFEPTNAWDNAAGTLSFGMTQINPVDPKSGAGDLINITLRALIPNAQTDFEIQDTSTLVRWSDVGAIEHEITNGTIHTESCAPSSLNISNHTVLEYEPVGTLVGTLTTYDPDSLDTHTYSLVDNANYPDNTSFQIVGDQLQTKKMFNFDRQSVYTIKIRTMDPYGKYYEHEFLIEVIDKDYFEVILPIICK